MTSAPQQLSTILAKDAAGEFRLWACRGEGRGCTRNTYRQQHKPCDDCVGPLDEDMTLEQIAEQLKRGDG